MHLALILKFFLNSSLKSRLFTIMQFAKSKIVLKIFFLIKFSDQPLGEALDLTITLILKILQIIMQYKLAWKLSTVILLSNNICFNNSNKHKKYFIVLNLFTRLIDFGVIILIFLKLFFFLLFAVIKDTSLIFFERNWHLHVQRRS